MTGWAVQLPDGSFLGSDSTSATAFRIFPNLEVAAAYAAQLDGQVVEVRWHTSEVKP